MNNAQKGTFVAGALRAALHESENKETKEAAASRRHKYILWPTSGNETKKGLHVKQFRHFARTLLASPHVEPKPDCGWTNRSVAQFQGPHILRSSVLYPFMCNGNGCHFLLGENCAICVENLLVRIQF